MIAGACFTAAQWLETGDFIGFCAGETASAVQEWRLRGVVGAFSTFACKLIEVAIPAFNQVSDKKINQ